MKLNVLHVIPSMSPTWGGPVKMLIGLAEALARTGISQTILATSENTEKTLAPREGEVVLFNRSPLNRFWTGHSFAVGKFLKKEIDNFDLVHIHEIWHYPHFAAYIKALEHNKPYIVTAHGELDQWSLDHKGLRKKIYSTLIQRKILDKASAIHALAEKEKENISNFTINKNINIIPNGIDLADFNGFTVKRKLTERYPKLKNKTVVLFLGRLHLIKGLDVLANVFAKISKEIKDVFLLLVGPDEGYKENILKILNKEGVTDRVIFTGMVTGQDKLDLLAGADIFVLPSYGEGFSMAILEAMACNLPVIITKGCNFPEVATAGAGVEINLNFEELTASLVKLINDKGLRTQMGEKGKDLIYEHYTWDKIALKMAQLYKTIIKPIT